MFLLFRFTIAPFAFPLPFPFPLVPVVFIQFHFHVHTLACHSSRKRQNNMVNTPQSSVFFCVGLRVDPRYTGLELLEGLELVVVRELLQVQRADLFLFDCRRIDG